MGAWLLFELTLKFFSFLAWPCVALVYPLCASIRAIETKSKYQTEKLVTYWILFSIISLFEHAFFNQLQRFPVWFFTRLAFVCWLVTPSFNGSVFVYKHFVQPCLSFDLQDAIDWFLHQTNSLQRRDHFLDKVDQYINDNGTEALEKLLASKLTSKMPKPCFVAEGAKLAASKDGKLKTTESYLVSEESNGVEEDSVVIKYEHGFMPPDIKVLNVTEKLEATEAKQKHVNTYTRKRMFEINETTTSVEVCGLDPLCLKLMSKIPSIVSDGAKLHAFDDGKRKYEHGFLPSGIKVLNVTEKMEATEAKQKQVNAYTRKRMFEINETTASVEVCGLDPFCLQLMRKIPSIVSDWAELLAFDDGELKMAKSCLVSEKSKAAVEGSDVMKSQENGVLPPDIKILKVPEKKEATEATQRIFEPKEIKETTTRASTEAYSSNHPPIIPTAFKAVQREWTCAICQVSATSETTLNLHLNGKRHNAACEKLKTTSNASKDKVLCSSVSKEEPKPNIVTSMNNQSLVEEHKWRCALCNVNCTGEYDLYRHLLGKKHISKSQA